MFSKKEIEFLQVDGITAKAVFSQNYSHVMRYRIKKRIKEVIADLKLFLELKQESREYLNEIAEVKAMAGSSKNVTPPILYNEIYDREIWINEWVDYMREIATKQQTLSLRTLLDKLIEEKEIISLSTKPRNPFRNH